MRFVRTAGTLTCLLAVFQTDGVLLGAEAKRPAVIFDTACEAKK